MYYHGVKYLTSSDIARIVGGTTDLRYQGGKARIANDLAWSMRGGAER